MKAQAPESATPHHTTSCAPQTHSSARSHSWPTCLFQHTARHSAAGHHPQCPAGTWPPTPTPRPCPPVCGHLVVEAVWPPAVCEEAYAHRLQQRGTCTHARTHACRCVYRRCASMSSTTMIMITTRHAVPACSAWPPQLRPHAPLCRPAASPCEPWHDGMRHEPS